MFWRPLFRTESLFTVVPYHPLIRSMLLRYLNRFLLKYLLFHQSDLRYDFLNAHILVSPQHFQDIFTYQLVLATQKLLGSF